VRFLLIDLANFPVLTLGQVSQGAPLVEAIKAADLKMKKPPANPTERECPACNGTGFPTVTQPVQPGHKIYPASCKECGGKGRITEAASLRSIANASLV
jgi:hypothetical protein